MRQGTATESRADPGITVDIMYGDRNAVDLFSTRRYVKARLSPKIHKPGEPKTLLKALSVQPCTIELSTGEHKNSTAASIRKLGTCLVETTPCSQPESRLKPLPQNLIKETWRSPRILKTPNSFLEASLIQHEAGLLRLGWRTPTNTPFVKLPQNLPEAETLISKRLNL